MTPSLLLLIDGAVNGDNQAVEELVRHTRAQVALVCRTLGSGDDVDDLVQETYLRVFRSLPGFRGEAASFLPWVLAIARNACATEVRRRVRRRQALDRFRAGRHEDAVPGPTSPAERSSLLAGLSSELREAFVLTQLVGLSYAEAAQTCDCPVGTIRSRVSRARAQLAAQVRADDRIA